MKHFVAGALWTVGYLAVVSLPVTALLLGPVPPGLGFWWDGSMAVAFAGLAVMGAQFGLTARFRRATAPFGIDIIYYFHRWMAVGGLSLVLAHYVILRATAPSALQPWTPGSAPWHMTAGRIALLLFTVVLVTSFWRKALRLEYDRWRWLHGALSVAAVGLAVAHVVGVSYYTRVPWKRALWGAYGGAWVMLLAYVRVVKPWRMMKAPWRVVSVRPEVPRVWTVTLEPQGHRGLNYLPGQFAWLTLGGTPFGGREHPFSISSGAPSDERIAFTIKELGDFTRTIGDTRVGESAWVDGPHGTFTVDRYPGAAAFGFIVGGVGIAPVMSMLRTLAARRDARPLYAVYGNDRWDEVLFREELERLRSVLDLRMTHVIRRPPAGWTGASGLLSEALLERALAGAPARTVYFLCGPRPMSETAQRGLRRMGVPLHRIHYEMFDMA